MDGLWYEFLCFSISFVMNILTKQWKSEPKRFGFLFAFGDM
jgi:hypothetical protein